MEDFIAFGDSDDEIAVEIVESQAGKLPPWTKEEYDSNDFTLNLHEEILDLVKYLEGQAKATDPAREKILQSIRQAVSPLEVKLFGSYGAGLHLPWSDLDLMIVWPDVPKPTQRQMTEIADKLEAAGISTSIEVISKATVPIIKFVSDGFPVDICFNNDSGGTGMDFVLRIMDGNPAFRPLLLTLKYFLHTRLLNEPYYGGVGSFLLICMLASHFEMYPRSCNPLPNVRFWTKANLGMILLTFLQTYGTQFNYVHTGISLRNGCHYFQKWEKTGFWDPSRPFMLSVENPLEPSKDVGKSSYDIMKVRAAFEWAFKELSFIDSNMDEPLTLLSRILPHANTAAFKNPNVKVLAPGEYQGTVRYSNRSNRSSNSGGDSSRGSSNRSRGGGARKSSRDRSSGSGSQSRSQGSGNPTKKRRT